MSVRINEKRYRDLKAEMMRLGLSRKRDVVEQAFRRLPFEPYAPVRRQLLRLLKVVNEGRKKRGFTPLRMSHSMRWRINRVKPFGEKSAGARGAKEATLGAATDAPLDGMCASKVPAASLT